MTTVANAVGSSSSANDTTIILASFEAFQPGFRVPLVVLSPDAKRGTVDHTVHDIGSILRSIESTFGLGSLGTSDARPEDFSSMFDYRQAPTKFVPLVSTASPGTLFRRSNARSKGLDRD